MSSVHHLENLLFFTLLQLVIIVLAARFANVAARRIGQPGAVGEMCAGLLLGPSLLGALAPETFAWVFKSVSAEPITIMSQIGLILLMFQIGIDFEFNHLKSAKNRRALMIVALGSILVPFAGGLLMGYAAHAHLAPTIPILPFALFVAVALCITAVPILGRILREYGLTDTRLGVLAISAAAINDVIGWILLTVISALALAQFSPQSTALQLLFIAAFLGFCVLIVRPLAIRWLARFDFADATLPPSALTGILALILLAGMCTYKLGIFAIFGGFVIGTLLYDQQGFVAAWKKQVGQFVLAFFLPIFFTYTGLRTNIAGLNDLALWGWALAFLAVAIGSKFLGVHLAARLSGHTHSESLILGSLMNTRALMELIVLNIGYDLGFIPQSVFTMLVIMAITTTILTGPMLRWLLPKIGHSIPKGVEA